MPAADVFMNGESLSATGRPNISSFMNNENFHNFMNYLYTADTHENRKLLEKSNLEILFHLLNQYKMRGRHQASLLWRPKHYFDSYFLLILILNMLINLIRVFCLQKKAFAKFI